MISDFMTYSSVIVLHHATVCLDVKMRESESCSSQCSVRSNSQIIILWVLPSSSSSPPPLYFPFSIIIVTIIIIITTTTIIIIIISITTSIIIIVIIFTMGVERCNSDCYKQLSVTQTDCSTCHVKRDWWDWQATASDTAQDCGDVITDQL